jgi:hypothetical protein
MADLRISIVRYFGANLGQNCRGLALLFGGFFYFFEKKRVLVSLNLGQIHENSFEKAKNRSF